MADRTSIEWTRNVDGAPGATWSPVTGCTRVSEGCLRCYIENTAPFRIGHRRFDGDTIGSTTGVQLHPERLAIPLTWRRPRKVFVCSLADLFHDDVPDQFVARVFATMAAAPQHQFQILSKRHNRMRALLTSPEFWSRFQVELASLSDFSFSAHMRTDEGEFLSNVWLGVTTENQKWADLRIPELLAIPAVVHWISAEPLLGAIDYSRFITRLDWIVVGGESGSRKARPMHPAWANAIHEQCRAAGVPMTFKQWGAWTPLAPMVGGKFDFSRGIAMTDDGNVYQPGELDYPHGPRRGEALRADFPHHNPTSMYYVGKKRAGRELYHDGRTFDEFPDPDACLQLIAAGSKQARGDG